MWTTLVMVLLRWLQQFFAVYFPAHVSQSKPALFPGDNSTHPHIIQESIRQTSVNKYESRPAGLEERGLSNSAWDSNKQTHFEKALNNRSFRCIQLPSTHLGSLQQCAASCILLKTSVCTVGSHINQHQI